MLLRCGSYFCRHYRVLEGVISESVSLSCFQGPLRSKKLLRHCSSSPQNIEDEEYNKLKEPDLKRLEKLSSEEIREYFRKIQAGEDVGPLESMVDDGFEKVDDQLEYAPQHQDHKGFSNKDPFFGSSKEQIDSYTNATIVDGIRELNVVKKHKLGDGRTRSSPPKRLKARLEKRTSEAVTIQQKKLAKKIEEKMNVLLKRGKIKSDWVFDPENGNLPQILDVQVTPCMRECKMVWDVETKMCDESIEDYEQFLQESKNAGERAFKKAANEISFLLAHSMRRRPMRIKFAHIEDDPQLFNMLYDFDYE